MNALIHKKCGAVIAYYDHKLERGEVIKAKYAKSVIGADIPIGSIINCPFCHNKHIPMRNLRQKDLCE